jgi:DNA-directed RNA polymerase II subunit RPB1
MDTFRFMYDPSIVRPIVKIDFDILGNDEIARMSALAGTHGIDIPDLYDKGDPKKGGLLDPKLGGSGNTLCATCQLDGKYCDGHQGHIDLGEPVFNVEYLHYVKNILDCICIGCSNLLISKETEKIKQILAIKSHRNRLAKVHDMASKVKYCMRENQGCGIQVSKIRVEIKKKTSVIDVYSEIDIAEGDDKKEKKKQRLPLTPDLIADILDNISDEDCMILGIDPKRSRPSDMIHKIFPVPPIHVRPSLRGTFTSGSTMEDGLTHKLGDIIKANSRMNRHKGDNNEGAAKYSKDHAQFLQFHVATYVDQDVITNPKADGKGVQFKSLVSRFKGKEGRLRGNLMGKRGDFNARTVITSDPVISSSKLGVPVKIAMNVTFPEIVTRDNIKEMTQLVRNGSDKYPGANFVFKASSMASGNRIRPIYLKFRKEEVTLQYGDVVERHLRDDDIVLFNRQPSLHKHSMMGHRIKVINNPSLLTYRLSPAVTTPYNADQIPLEVSNRRSPIWLRNIHMGVMM